MPPRHDAAAATMLFDGILSAAIFAAAGVPLPFAFRYSVLLHFRRVFDTSMPGRFIAGCCRRRLADAATGRQIADAWLPPAAAHRQPCLPPPDFLR